MIVRCGSVGDDTKVKTITQDAKIIYAFGASSTDTKCVGMIGFTFYKPQQQDIELISVELKKTESKTVLKKEGPRKSEVKVRRVSVLNKK